MRTITDRPVFQGDVMIRRICNLPSSAKIKPAVGVVHILALSETGHHHVIESLAAERFIDEANAFIAYLRVGSESEIRHLRDFDTHDPILLTPGIYEVRQQREYVAKGFRRVED